MNFENFEKEKKHGEKIRQDLAEEIAAICYDRRHMNTEYTSLEFKEGVDVTSKAFLRVLEHEFPEQSMTLRFATKDLCFHAMNEMGMCDEDED